MTVVYQARAGIQLSSRHTLRACLERIASQMDGSNVTDLSRCTKKVNDDSYLNGVQLNMLNNHAGVKVRRQKTTKVFRDETFHLTKPVDAIPPLFCIFALIFRSNRELFCLNDVVTLTAIARY